MKIPNLFLILLFEKDRKVSFGIWLFAVATALLVHALIDADKWILCVTFTSALIGGGTIMDKFLASKKPEGKTDAPTPAA